MQHKPEGISVTEIDTPESKAEQKETSLPTDSDYNIKVTNKITTIQVIINRREFETEVNDNKAARQFTEMLLIQLDRENLLIYDKQLPCSVL